jgi:fucose 4-O-acetylase-like acetyltransferase
MTSPAARQVAPDFIRGVAIVLMVFGHITYVGSTADAQARLTTWIYTFHMPIFLVVSGYFFDPAEALARKAEKTFRRFVVPYLIFLPLYLVGLIGVRRMGIGTNNTPPASVMDFLSAVFVHPHGAYWFLHALILMTVCFVIAAKIAALLRAGDASLLTLFALCLGLCCAGGILGSWVAAYFLIGMALTRGNMPIPASLPVGLIGMVGSVCFVETGAMAMSLAGLVWCLSIISVLAALARSGSGRFVGSVAWLGRNTLIILLGHAMFVVALKPARGLFLSLDPTGIVYALTVTAVAITGCLLMSVALDVFGVSLSLFGVARVYRPRRQSTAASHILPIRLSPGIVRGPGPMAPAGSRDRVPGLPQASPRRAAT